MSWYRDTQLFMQHHYSSFYFRRAVKKLTVGTDSDGSPSDFFPNDLEYYDFSKHLSLGNNKESDYDAFLSYFKTKPTYTYINSEGLVLTYQSSRACFSVAREDTSSPFYKLPTLLQAQQDQLKSLEKEVSDLQEELKREKDDKKALEKKISELLASKTEESCGADEEEWMSTGHTVPSNWVPFDDLDVQAFPKDNHLTITKVEMGAREDPTTNVQPKRFYGGVFPIVVVNVAEIPNRDDARFDPEIWSLYINEGTCYAARKPFQSEM